MYEVLVHDQVVKMLHTKSMTVNDRICQVLNLQNQLFSNKQKNPKKLEPLKPRCCDFFFGMSGHIVVGWLVGVLLETLKNSPGAFVMVDSGSSGGDSGIPLMGVVGMPVRQSG